MNEPIQAQSLSATQEAVKMPGALAKLDRIFVRATEAALVLLLSAIFLLLTWAIAARYLFARPLLWSDEVLYVLSGWFVMIGSTVAFHRNLHLKLTGFSGMLPASARATYDLFAMAAVIAVLGLLLIPSISNLHEQMQIQLPMTGLPQSWRAAAIAFGFVAMFLVGVVRFIRSARSFFKAGLAIVGVLLGTGAIWVVSYVTRDAGNVNLFFFFFVLLLLCICLGVPIAFCFAIATISYFVLMTDLPLSLIVERIDHGMSNPMLLSIPLFILLGSLMEITGMARAMVNFLAALVSRVRGGMSYVLLAAMYLISGISGAKAADMAAVAPVLFPEMKRRGADPRELVALLNASAVMSETIPPSLVLIIIGTTAGVSIASLFTGGLLPALVAALILSVFIYFRSSGEKVLPVESGSPSKLRSFVYAAPALLLPFLIRGLVVEGVATAMEVATLGVIYTVVCGLVIYRDCEWHKVWKVMVDASILSGVLIIIIGMAYAMSLGLALSGLSQKLAAMIASMPGGVAGFMAISILVFVVFGSILEGIPALLLFAPLLFPVAHQLGIHEVHYAMVAIIAMGIGLYAPPFGVGYYTSCAISGVDPSTAMRAVWPYLFALMLALILITAVPWISIGFL